MYEIMEVKYQQNANVLEGGESERCSREVIRKKSWVKKTHKVTTFGESYHNQECNGGGNGGRGDAALDKA